MEESARPRTILIVDDESSIRTFVTTVLSQFSYNLLTADSGDEALRCSREYDGPIDLLLSDVQMPGITGMELATKIQNERREIRVMLMSGYASGMLVLNDGWHFLHKPFVATQLLALVSGVLNSQVPTAIQDWNEHKKSS